jgi:hypothetical protein
MVWYQNSEMRETFDQPDIAIIQREKTSFTIRYDYPSEARRGRTVYYDLILYNICYASR